MDHNPIGIKKIKARDILDFTKAALSDPNYRDIVPVSMSRAIAHSKNPYAEKEDVVLLVAYKDGRCVGYHGILPGLLQRDGNFSPVFWGSTFFVSNPFRGRGVGKALLENIKSLNVDFVVTGMTGQAKKALKDFGLKRLGQLIFCQIRLDRIKIFSGFKKRLFYRLMLNQMSANVKDFRYIQVKQIKHSEDAATLGTNSPHFYRGIDLINWMLRYPWIQSSGEMKNRWGRYYFSEVRDIFRYIALEIYSGEMELYQGFLILSISRTRKKTVVKVLDYNFNNPADSKIACLLTVKYARDVLADRIEFPLCLEADFSCKFLRKFFLKRQKRTYLFLPKDKDSALANSAGELVLKFCDGDIPFS